MRTYRVVNLVPVLRSPHMGQAREFEVLSDQVLARICSAVDAYNDADTSWASPDAAAGERTQRDSTATIQGVINGVSPGLKNAAIWEIRKYCDNADAVLDTVIKPGPGTPPAVPPSQDMVPSVDPNRPPPEQPPAPPPNDYPPVATGQRGPGRGAFGYRPRVETGQPGPGFMPPPSPPIPLPTGSEPEPESPPPPPPPPYIPPPSVATPSVGCWYVMGKGYMWGERPSGGESTGLNQKDCQDLIARDTEIRTGQTSVSQQASCDPLKGQFYDPRTGQCRGSVSSFPNIPFGGEGSTTSATDFNTGTDGATSFMGRGRIPLSVNPGWNDRHRAFLPSLNISRKAWGR